MTPNFEVFQRPARTSDDGPTVTISPGALILSRPALEVLGKPEHVELLFDRGSRIVGVRPAAGVDRRSAFKVTVTRSGTGRVAHRSFVNHYGIPDSPARRWPACVAGGVLCVDLNGDSTLISRNGRAADRG